MIAPVEKPLADKPVAPQQDYFDAVHRKTWLRRSAGLLGGLTIGIAFGAAIGLIAAFVPSLLVSAGIAESAAALTVAVVAKSAAIFAAAGALMGFGAMATTGSDAGAMTAGLEQMDKAGALGKSVSEPSKPFKLFNWKAAIVTVPLGIGVGALLAATGIPVGVAALGFASESTAGIISSGAVFGMTGSLFAQPFGTYTTKLSNFYTKVLTGKLFDKQEVAQAAIATQAPAQEVALAPDVSQGQGKSFSKETSRFSLQGIIEKTEEHAPVQTQR